jgi:zinc transport system substrate-binding protein
MKKVFAAVLALTLLAVSLAPCAALAENKRISVVVTIFPIYDWVREIAGENAENIELTMLLDSGADLHNFQPTAPDILKVSSADLCIFVGGESDEWTEDVLAVAATNAQRRTVNLVEALGDQAKAEELVEGMEHEDEDHDHEEHDHEHETEMDEHVWLSLRNAQVLCRAIADALCEIDPDSAALYRSNLAAYEEKLSALDQAYTEAVAASAYKTILFGDRFPFRYLVDDYGLEYYAAFVGCSAETEASFETIAFLAQKVDELGLPAVMTIEGTDHRIAETIVQNTQSKDQQILTMDSMQSVTSKDVQNGATYLSVMESNLSVLKDALE